MTLTTLNTAIWSKIYDLHNPTCPENVSFWSKTSPWSPPSELSLSLAPPPTDPPSSLTRCYFIVTEFTFSTRHFSKSIAPFVWNHLWENAGYRFLAPFKEMWAERCKQTNKHTQKHRSASGKTQKLSWPWCWLADWLLLKDTFEKYIWEWDQVGLGADQAMLSKDRPRVLYYWQLFVPVIMRARVSTGLLCDRPCNHL